MLREIYEKVAGARTARLLRQTDFQSFDEFRKAYETRTCTMLVQINEEQLTDVMCWLSDEDDICFDTDPQSLINRRMQKLSCADVSVLDPLTSILDRTTMVKALKAIAAEHADANLSILLCDIDDLQAINDTDGKDAGDVAIRSLTDTLRDSINEREILARVGGNRFAIMSERVGEELDQLGTEIRKNTEVAYQDTTKLTISIGASSGPASECIGSTMSQADEAMYMAKVAGKNRYLHFDEFKPISDMANASPDITTDEQRMRFLAERVNEYVAMRRTLKAAKAEARAGRKHTRRFQDQLGNENFEAEGFLSLAFVEVDQFHRVSRKHGKRESERVFNTVCDIVRTQIRETDWLGRYGGKEFCIVMPKTTLEAAYKILERLRERIETTEIISSETGDIEEITLSIGAIESIGDETHRELLARAAEMALKAKNTGRNRVCV